MHLLSELVVESLPNAFFDPLAEVAVHGRTGRQVVGEGVPLAAIVCPVENGIEDFADVHGPLSAASPVVGLARWNEWL